MKKLEKSVQDEPDDPPAIKKMKHILAEELEGRQVESDKEKLAIASLMNPYIKMNFVEPYQKFLVKEMFVSKVESVCDGETDVENPPAKKMKPACPDLEEWMFDNLDVEWNDQPQTGKRNIAVEEVDRYLMSSVSSTDTILGWWKENQKFFPHIAKLAKKYLAIPASSVPSERVFSFTGNLVNKKRARLSPKTVSTFVFLNKNMIHYW